MSQCNSPSASKEYVLAKVPTPSDSPQRGEKITATPPQVESVAEIGQSLPDWTIPFANAREDAAEQVFRV
jgi:hypothetical protein